MGCLEKLLKLGRLQRPGEEVTSSPATPDDLQAPCLLCLLDTFSHNLHLKRVAKVDDGADDCLRAGIVSDVSNEGLVDLEDVDGQVL